MSDFLKAFVCAGVAVVCFTAPEWVPAWAAAARAEVECCVQPEDADCSGATPECPSHWEAYDLGFTSYEAENSLPPSY